MHICFLLNLVLQPVSVFVKSSCTEINFLNVPQQADLKVNFSNTTTFNQLLFHHPIEPTTHGVPPPKPLT